MDAERDIMVDAGERRLRRLEQQIARARMLLGIGVVLDASLLAWTVQTGAAVSAALRWVSAIGVGVLALGTVVLYAQIGALLEAMEE